MPRRTRTNVPGELLNIILWDIERKIYLYDYLISKNNMGLENR